MRKFRIFLLFFVISSVISFGVLANMQLLDVQLQQACQYIKNRGFKVTPYLLIVDISNQCLSVYYKGQKKKDYIISTSKRGIGQNIGTLKTPLGLHVIHDKYGDGVPNYGIFRNRKFTGSVWPKFMPRAQHKKDFIVTRILRLGGMEAGLNLGNNKAGSSVDSLSRGIYIHGTTMEWKLGKPCTIGCVHMSSTDLIELFDMVPVGSQVLFSEA